MTQTTKQKMETMTIKVPKEDLKRLRGIADAMGWELEEPEYFESAQFYKDITEAEAAIANGEGTRITNLEELEELIK